LSIEHGAAIGKLVYHLIDELCDVKHDFGFWIVLVFAHGESRCGIQHITSEYELHVILEIISTNSNFSWFKECRSSLNVLTLFIASKPFAAHVFFQGKKSTKKTKTQLNKNKINKKFFCLGGFLFVFFSINKQQKNREFF